MTLAELLQYLDENSQYAILDGTPEETLTKARAGTHKDALAGEIIRHMQDAAGASEVGGTIDRATAATSLGPLRLRYMRDDAPVEGFRMVERIILAIDLAFDAEALRQRGR